MSTTSENQAANTITIPTETNVNPENTITETAEIKSTAGDGSSDRSTTPVATPIQEEDVVETNHGYQPRPKKSRKTKPRYVSEDIFPMFFGTSKKSMDEIDYTLKPRRKKQSSSSRPSYHRTTYPQHPPVQMVRTRRNYHPKSSIPSAYPPPPYPVYSGQRMGHSKPQYDPYNDYYSTYPPTDDPRTITNYKTKVCTHYATKGFCSYGEACNFLHPKHDMELLRGSMQKLNPYADEYMDDTQMYEMYRAIPSYNRVKDYANGRVTMPVPYRGGMNEKSNQIWSRISAPKTPIGIALSPNSKQLKNAKTKLCYHFSTKGKCAHGANCSYIHDAARRFDINKEFTNRNICKYFVKGKCQYGNKCVFKHPMDEHYRQSSDTSNESWTVVAE